MGIAFIGGADIPATPAGQPFSFTSRGNSLALSFVVGNTPGSVPTGVSVADSAGNSWHVVYETAPVAGVPTPLAGFAYSTTASPITSLTVSVTGAPGAKFAGHVFDAEGITGLSSSTTGTMLWQHTCVSQSFVTPPAASGLEYVFVVVAGCPPTFTNSTNTPVSSSNGSVGIPGNVTTGGGWAEFTYANPSGPDISVGLSQSSVTGANVSIPVVSVILTGTTGLAGSQETGTGTDSAATAVIPLKIINKVSVSGSPLSYILQLPFLGQ